MLPGQKPGKDYITYCLFVDQWQRNTVYDMVPKLLRMIEGLDPHSLSLSSKLALLFLQIGCKKSDIP